MYIIYPPSKKNWGHHAVAVLALLMLFPLMRLCPIGNYARLPDAAHPEEMRHFQITQQIQNAGGIVAFIRGFYRGDPQWKETDPLYPLLLMSVAQKDPIDFARNARAVNFLLALLAAVLLLWTLRRSEGEVLGWLAILAFLAPLYFGKNSSLVGPQWLSLICAYLGWFNLVEETDEEAKGMSAGIWIGLAFLTSAVGAALFFLVLIYFLATTRLKILQQKSLWVFLLEFAFAGSSILVRDFWIFKNPFHTLLSFFPQLGWPAPEFLQTQAIWVLGLIAAFGILFDPDRGRRVLSLLYLAVLLFVIRKPATSFVLSFYSAAVIHTLSANLLRKALVWIALPCAAFLCGWAWYSYLY